MKRQWMLFWVLCAALLLTACGGNQGENTREYLEILQSGSYYLTANGSYEGNYYLVEEAVQDGNFNIAYRNANDSNFRYLYRDGVMYRYLLGIEIYAVADEYVPDDALIGNMIDYDYSTARYAGHDKQTVLGVTYDYDIYTSEKYSGEEASLYLYLSPEHDTLHAIAFPEDSIMITVSQLSSEIPDDIFFEFPGSYQEVDYLQVESQPEI